LPYDNALGLLKKIPGISSKSVEYLVSGIGLDMSIFPAEKHLVSWAGKSPGNNEIADKKSLRTTQVNKQVKATLTEIVWAASRTKGSFLSSKCNRLVGKRGK
jgi:transposase